MLTDIQRVLLDFDGVMFDSQRLHAEVEAQLAARHGVRVRPEEISAKFAGWPTPKVFAEILGCDAQSAERLSPEKWTLLQSRVADAIPLAPLHLIVRRIRERGISLAIGTSSPSWWPKKVLSHHGWANLFADEDIVGGEMVEHGKPDPEIWIRASRGVAPANCLVVEDGEAGVVAAQRAGMSACLLLPLRHPYARSIHGLTDLV